MNELAAFIQFTAAHEVGHLYGAAHDTAHLDLVPLYPYGYGFWATNNGKDWGTIMSYYGVGDRQMFFSNPDSLFRGVHRGTVTKCNVTRLHRERGATIAAFRSPQAKVTISNRTFKGQEFGDVMATDSITVNGPDTIRDTAQVLLRANKKVIINSGFVLAQNASLTIQTGSTALLGKRKSDKQINYPNPKPEAKTQEIQPNNFCFQAGLNNGAIKIRYAIPWESIVHVRLFDLSGRLAFEKTLGKKTPGVYIENINFARCLKTRIYLVELKAGNSVQTATVTAIR